jgi:serine/threonine-protein kinase
MPLEPGNLIDSKYHVLRCIGEGGMGAVYLGENTRIRRRVAIKVLHASVAENAEVVQRFEREAQAAGCIGNDHILEVLDIGALPNGERYIVMEFLDGEPLSRRMTQLTQLTPAQLAPLIAQLLAGLGAAHGAGITHRDLKPDNVFILKQKAGQRDFVKIIDFGISKFAQVDGAVNVTRAGAMMGTPLYMSPEQARGSAEADARSDLYAVGVIMYEATAGRPPFTAESFNELLFQIVLGEITPLHAAAPGIDPAFSAIVMKAMARDPKDRFQSAAEFRSALEVWAAGAGISLRISAAPGEFGQTPIPGQLPGRGTPYPVGARPGGQTPQAVGQAHPTGPRGTPGSPPGWGPAISPVPTPQAPQPSGWKPAALGAFAALVGVVGVAAVAIPRWMHGRGTEVLPGTSAASRLSATQPTEPREPVVLAKTAAPDLPIPSLPANPPTATASGAGAASGTAGAPGESGAAGPTPEPSTAAHVRPAVARPVIQVPAAAPVNKTPAKVETPKPKSNPDFGY